MTLEEAIEHCKSIACETSDCGMEHAQLAEWLEELKQRREQEEPISEDLEDAAIEYCSGNKGSDARVRAGFIMGANWQKEQLLRNAFEFTESHNIACVLASECLRGNGWFNKERDFNDLFRYLSCVDELFEGKFSGKTKVIAIKED